MLKLAGVFLEGEGTINVWGPDASTRPQATVLYSSQKTSQLRITIPIEICVYGTTVSKDEKKASVFISKLMQLMTYGINNAENLGLSTAQARGPGIPSLSLPYPFRIPSISLRANNAPLGMNWDGSKLCGDVHDSKWCACVLTNMHMNWDFEKEQFKLHIYDHENKLNNHSPKAATVFFLPPHACCPLVISFMITCVLCRPLRSI